MRRAPAVAVAILLAAVSTPAWAIHGGPHLLWDAPQTSADGTPLTDLAKYQVYRKATTPCVAPATPGPPPAATKIGEVLAPVPDPPVGATAGFDVAQAQSGLFACVTAVDTTGNESAPSNTVAMPDMAAPPVAITAPAAGATVSGIVTVTATAADNVAVVGVQFKVDGLNIGVEDTAAPYTVPWDSTTVPNGSHVLTAVARDATPGSGAVSAPITVTVANAPVVPAAPGNLRLQ